MSVFDFSKALNGRAFRTIINRSQNILNTTAENLRATELSKAKTSFTITPTDIRKVLSNIPKTSSNALTDEEIQLRLRAAGKLFRHNKKNLPVKIQKDKASGNITRLTFNAITYSGGIDKIVKEIFGTEAEHIPEYFQKGHVRSLATASLGKVSQQFGSGTSLKPEFLEFSDILDGILKHLKQLDRDSANLPDAKAEVLANSRKRYDKHVVELQLKTDNILSGGIAGSITGPLRQYVNSYIEGRAKSSFNALEKALKTSGATEELMSQLATVKGSPSLIQLLELKLLSALDPKQFKEDNKTYSLQNVPANKLELFKLDRVSVSKLRTEISKEKQRIQELKRKIKLKEKYLRTKSGKFGSIANLHTIIQESLADQIKENMGAGDRTDILNLRTGRFAESTQVVHTRFNRHGSLEIFFKYMKYPYGTFAPGGRQGSPLSRDPNRLIARSIRQVASGLVTNRLKVSPL